MQEARSTTYPNAGYPTDRTSIPSPQIVPDMNGYEYLDYIASCCSYKDDKKKRIDEVINIVGMAEGGKRRIKRLPHKRRKGLCLTPKQ